MTALLDTHTLLWSAYSTRKLSRLAADIIGDANCLLLVSAATAWEIATKVRLGKMPDAATLERDFVQILGKSGFAFRPITVEDALRAGRLTGKHRDPFDRMIAAQALADDIPVISIDPKLDLFGVRRIW